MLTELSGLAYYDDYRKLIMKNFNSLAMFAVMYFSG